MLAGLELTPTAPLDEREQPSQRPVAAGARCLVFVPSSKLLTDDNGYCSRWRSRRHVPALAVAVGQTNAVVDFLCV